MSKTILITGATSGIGLETAKKLLQLGHHVIAHGRSDEKLAGAVTQMKASSGSDRVDAVSADLSNLEQVDAMASAVLERHSRLDVLINNAGVFNATDPISKDGIDVRFAVNVIAPYLLTRRLLSSLGESGRVVNLSSAAQAPVNLNALTDTVQLTDNSAYAQSKLALTMWTSALAEELGPEGPVVVAENPASLLATKMVNEAFGVPGSDVQRGVDILVRASLSDEFNDASGKYFDNDRGRFSDPHADALDASLNREVIKRMDEFLSIHVR
ncbi:MAG: SDR family NAD(P)-dependent oxidoreductase [Rhodopirellula sp. JB044]|uniref:SDR family NAD(P)-dependent oxidoreductase n=1 Tax=Rhodopirellula sp. JB044 TaxID=3342844 RepID=UPI00370A4433